MSFPAPDSEGLALARSLARLRNSQSLRDPWVSFGSELSCPPLHLLMAKNANGSEGGRRNKRAV